MSIKFLRKFSTSRQLPFASPIAKVLNPVAYVRWKMGVIDNARELYEKCSDSFEFLQKDLKLNDGFEGWFNCTVLHCWLLQKKMIPEGQVGVDLNQELTRHLWADVEIKLHQAGVRNRIGTIVADLVSSYQGQFLAYDEGLYYGDPVLAAALWRNLHIGGKHVSACDLAKTLTYTRKQLQHLDQSDFQNLNFS